MASLFEKSCSTINEYILNIFEEGELEKESSVRKIGNSDFFTKPTNYYNLDVVISVGYRVKSLRGTQFRQWATKRLNEYIRKGFTMDDERLKQAAAVYIRLFYFIKIFCFCQFEFLEYKTFLLTRILYCVVLGSEFYFPYIFRLFC